MKTDIRRVCVVYIYLLRAADFWYMHKGLLNRMCSTSVATPDRESKRGTREVRLREQGRPIWLAGWPVPVEKH